MQNIIENCCDMARFFDSELSGIPRVRILNSLALSQYGHVILPSHVAKRYGLVAGTKVRLEEDATCFRSADNLARVDVEVPSKCNLDCVTCMRNVWDEANMPAAAACGDKVLSSALKIFVLFYNNLWYASMNSNSGRNPLHD